MQRTLKRESKVLEIVKRETAGARKKPSRKKAKRFTAERDSTPLSVGASRRRPAFEGGGQRRERTIPSTGSSGPSKDFPSSASAHPSPGRVSVGRANHRDETGLRRGCRERGLAPLRDRTAPGDRRTSPRPRRSPLEARGRKAGGRTSARRRSPFRAPRDA